MESLRGIVIGDDTGSSDQFVCFWCGHYWSRSWGSPFGTQGVWLWTPVEMSVAHWKKRSIRPYCTHFVVCMRSILGTLPLTFFLFLFSEGGPSVPIVLTQLYFKYDTFWHLKPSALLACYFQNGSKCGKLSSCPGRLEKAGIGVLLGSLLL